MRCHEDIRWWLRSSTGPYGLTCAEEAYGETMIHSTNVVLGDVSLGRVVGVFS